MYRHPDNIDLFCICYALSSPQNIITMLKWKYGLFSIIKVLSLLTIVMQNLFYENIDTNIHGHLLTRNS